MDSVLRVENASATNAAEMATSDLCGSVIDFEGRLSEHMDCYPLKPSELI